MLLLFPAREAERRQAPRLPKVGLRSRMVGLLLRVGVS